MLSRGSYAVQSGFEANRVCVHFQGGYSFMFCCARRKAMSLT